MEASGRDRDSDAGGANMSTMSFDGGGSIGSQARSVKRPRPVKSCTECRKRKLKCDRLCPCSQCQKSRRLCKYAASDPDGPGLSDGSDAESAVERPTKRLTSRPAVQPPQQSQPPLQPPFQPVQSQDATALVPAPMPASLILNGSDVQQITAALVDEFSARLERLEKLMMARDHPSPDLSVSMLHAPRAGSAASSTIRGLTVKGKTSLRTRYFGQNSTRVLLNLVSLMRLVVRGTVR